MRQAHILPCILAASLFCSPPGAGADPASPAPEDASVRLQQIFGGSPTEQLFTDQFLAAVSLSRLQTIVSQVKSQVGDFVRVTGSSSPYTLVMAKGTVSVAISLDTAGKVQGLRILAINPASGSLQETLESFDELPGTVSYLITRDGETVAARSPGQPLAVGSSFKLAVLRALRDEIEKGRLAWNQVVELQERWRSLPSGILQDWPAGSSITLETLATLMISLSDNTASDALIDIVGREKVEAYAPDSRPLLTTREFFLLKKPENRNTRERYLAADAGERRQILAELEGELPSPDLFSGEPVAPRIEWFMSTEQLTRLIRELSDIPLLSVNSGPAQPGNWRRVAYKGGSEPGIINMTLYLESAEGTAYTVSVTWNRTEAAIDESRFVTLVQGLLGSLGQAGRASSGSESGSAQ
jgi:beta-lactamase class A